MAICKNRLAELQKKEEEKFEKIHPKSAQLAKEARQHLLSGVPMPWMVRLPGTFPLFFKEAKGAQFVDADGISYVDFCLGDTGAMTGHGLEQVADALSFRARRGITTMLPSDDAIWVANELSSRFGLPYWQLAMTATDANRFVLRFARFLTGKPKICCINYCYHGTVDETLAVLDENGNVVPRSGAIGPQVHVRKTTRVVPFNDIAALEKALAHGDVACVLMEPAMTNIGIVLPKSGYLKAVREVTRRYGVLLIIDETHTICVGPGGATRAWNLEPDFFVMGKPLGGGMPCACYGISKEVGDALMAKTKKESGSDVDVSGVGGTLTGNALALAAIRATLSHTLREEDFKYMIPLATRWKEGVASVIKQANLPWHVTQLGCRAEYWFCEPPENGEQAASQIDHELEAFLHLYCLNRGILLTPFHNMALMSPFHKIEDVDKHTQVFADAVGILLNKKISINLPASRSKL